MVESLDGLRKKHEDLKAHCAVVEQSLALYTQRCADLEVERQTYLASHAALVRKASPLPSLPGLPPVSTTAWEVGMQLSKILLLIGLIVAVAVK